jgi:excisionase family DNA binding protein
VSAATTCPPAAALSGEALLSPKNLALRLGVSKSTVIVWTHAGIIEAEIAVGKLWKFDPSAVLARLREHTQAARKARISN